MALRSLLLAVLTLAATLLLGLSTTMTTTPELLAKTLIMRGTSSGTFYPSDDEYRSYARGYLTHSRGVAPDEPLHIVDYPAAFFPISPGGLSDPTYDESVAIGVANLHEAADGEDSVVFFGYSQSAVVGSTHKRDLVEQYADNPDDAPDIEYVFVSNPARPNGGILMRFEGMYIPIIGVTFDGATPTQTPGAEPGEITTYDISREYDGWSDFPAYPLNVVATANAVLGIVYLHGTYHELDPAILNDPTKTDVSTYGDTKYYLIRTERLPLLMLAAQLGVPEPVLVAADPPLRVIVDLGYDRETPYGVPTRAGLMPVVNPITVATDLGSATSQGISDGVTAASVPAPTATTTAATTGSPSTGPATENPPPKTKPTSSAANRPAKPKVRGPIGADDDPFTGVVKSLQDSLARLPGTGAQTSSTTDSTGGASADGSGDATSSTSASSDGTAG